MKRFAPFIMLPEAAVGGFVNVRFPPIEALSPAAQPPALPVHLGICAVAPAAGGSNCGAARLIVPAPVIGPPVRPLPVATLLTVPAAGACHCRLVPSVARTLPADAPATGESL